MTKDQQKRSFDGIVFDSILEMRFYRDVIRPKMASGDIKTCQLQKEYVLQPMFTYNGKWCSPSPMWRTFTSSTETAGKK